MKIIEKVKLPQLPARLSNCVDQKKPIGYNRQNANIILDIGNLIAAAVSMADLQITE